MAEDKSEQHARRHDHEVEQYEREAKRERALGNYARAERMGRSADMSRAMAKSCRSR